MNIKHLVVGSMIAVSAMVGCSNQKEEQNVIRGRETVLQIGDTVNAFSDINGDDQVDLYCRGSAKSAHPFDRHTLQWSDGAQCFLSSSYKQSLSAPAVYEGRFHQYGLLLQEMPVMSAEVESRVNGEYQALNQMGSN